MFYTPVAGTHGREAREMRDWFQSGSLFAQMMRDHGWYRNADQFMFWSTALAGTFFTHSGHLVWEHGGEMLRHFLATQPYEHRVVFAHSHGGQIVAYALEQPGVQVRAVVTIDSPIRRDMDARWRRARASIDYHEHLYGTWWGSRMRWLGQRGRFQRTMPWADRNTHIEGGHSGILRNPAHFGQWLPVLQRVQTVQGKGH